jgi:GMP synthase PP-ATPase subunit
MVEVNTLNRLAQGLLASAQAQDWPSLQRLDAEMAEVLRRAVSVQHPLPGWSEAVTRLREVHEQALQACCRARDKAREELHSFCAQREIVEAYALTQDMEIPI